MRAPFDRLVQIRNDIAHRLPPKGEEAWKSMGRDVLNHLRTILEQFSFLQHYDLIRVVERRGDEYQYERYTGQKITSHCERLQGRGELQIGWFYLSRKDRSVLRLQPLLVFWSDEGEPELSGEGRHDTAMYERLLKEMAEYIATVVWRTVEQHDAGLVAQLWQLIYYNLERVKMARKRTELSETAHGQMVLSWTVLRQAAQDVTTTQMGAVREKYQRTLYLQRTGVFAQFRKFLDSDKGCFVLTGKSGVGKSNFVLSLTDEFAGQEDVCLLMYNGARLSIPETAIRTISQDLARYLNLEEEAKDDLFAELERQGEMAGKMLIVVFDAINENADGKVLLRQIDQMVGEVQYPWLKVVITSRPHAWRTLKRGIRLAEERYYRERGSDEYWVELQEFTVKLEPFEREELPQVYKKYRQAYGLQTEYDALEAPMRRALRDPLILRLVAEANRGQAIPERIRVSDIYDQYVQALLRTERLYQEDIILLERELVPLMITEEHYDNKLMAARIHTAETRNGQPLWELIHSDDLLSSGRRVNDSYVRLSDAEILTEQGPPTDYEITFKYERFYDHYGGKRLLEVIDERRNEREMTYRELTQALRVHPFLWGPIKTALKAELGQNNTELFIRLAQIPDDITKQLLVTALSEYGQDDPETVQPILKELVVLREQTARWQFWRRREYKGISPELFTARKVAIETAANLEIWEILVIAACDSSASVRMHTVQYIHRLWNRNAQVALEALTNLSRRIKGKLGIPRSAVFESAIGASALIAFEHYRNPAVIKQLQQLWRGILEQLLLVRESETGLSGTLRRRLRELAVSLMARLLVRLMQLVPSSHSNLNVTEMEHFFRLNSEDKQRFRDLLPYLDSTYGNLDDMWDDLMAMARNRDIFTMYLVWLVLSGRVRKNYQEITSFLSPMFKASLDLDPPGPVTMAVLNIVSDLTVVNPEGAHEALDLLDAYVWEYYDKSGGMYWTEDRVYQHTVLDWFVVRNYQVSDTYYSDSLLSRLAKDKEADRPSLHRMLFLTEMAEMEIGLVDMVVAYGYPILALRVAELAVGVKDATTQRGLYKFLARLRKSHQEAVGDLIDDFIDDFNLQTDEIRRAEAAMSGQTVGEVLFVTAMLFLLEIQSRPIVLREVRALLDGMLECEKSAQLIELFIKRIVNFVYGSPVFDVPEPQS